VSAICQSDFAFPLDIGDATRDRIRRLIEADVAKILAQGTGEIGAHPWFDGIEWEKVHEDSDVGAVR
jgi:hypothetical protein